MGVADIQLCFSILHSKQIVYLLPHVDIGIYMLIYYFNLEIY